MPQPPQPPELNPRNPWDAHERVTQAIDLILPLAETDLGIRGIIRAAVGEMRTAQNKLDQDALVEALTKADGRAMAGAGGVAPATP